MKSVAKFSAVALIASLALVGCSVDADAPVGKPLPLTSEPAASAQAPDASPAPAAKEIPAPVKNKLAEFGQSFVYTDQLSITVTPNGAATASEWAAGADSTGGAMYLFTVEIANGSEEIFDPAMFRSEVNYGPDGLAASRVFDSSQNLGDSFQGRILPGKKQSVQIAYAIPTDQLDDVLMIVSPSFDHKEQLFTGPLS